jgi:hypothetical protein
MDARTRRLMMSEEMWFDEYEAIGQEYGDGDITRAVAVARMEGLGFDKAEIEDELGAIDQELRENMIAELEAER